MGERLRLFEATFQGYGYGGKAQVIAHDEREARSLLMPDLEKFWKEWPYRHSPDRSVVMTEIDLGTARVLEFDDGEYD